MFKFSQFWKTCSPLIIQELLRESVGRQNLLGNRLPQASFSKKRRPSKTKTNARKKQGELISRGRNVIPTRTFDQVPSRTSETSTKMEDNENGKPLGVTFTFVSYNILAQDLLEKHPYLYKFCDAMHLEWRHRLDRLVDEILPLRPDILALQEVQKNHIEDILQALKSLNYDFYFKKKTGSHTDGCAILFNKDMFELVEMHTVEYYQPHVDFLNRDNVAVIAKMCIKGQPTSCFIASTTHLLYNPRRQDVRLAQVELLLAELDQISFKKYKSGGEVVRYPIILSGDFNLKPHTAPYRLITTGHLTYQNLTLKTLQPPDENQATVTGPYFLPRHLGITDNCQHYDVVKSKYKERSRVQNTDKQKFHCTEPAHETDSIHGEDKDYLFSTGKLRHFLNLASVYDHNRKRDATTFQEKWVTVDYIFYSQHCNSMVNLNCGGLLKLVARYSLPSAETCSNMGLVIPNAHLGSDHLSLAAKFYFEGPVQDGKKSGKKTVLLNDKDND